MMFAIRNSLVVVICGTLAASTGSAQLLDFTGQIADASSWMVPCLQCGGDVSVNSSTTMPGEFAKWTTETLGFTDAMFAARYGASSHVMQIRQLEPATMATGQTTLQFIFPQPLQAGSEMIIFDVDAVGEQFTISKDNGPFGMPIQMESVNGTTSTFAAWDPVGQKLVSQTDGFNQKEAYIFDVAGATTVTLVYETDFAAIADVSFNVVPEPNTLALFLGIAAVSVLARCLRPGAASGLS